MQHDGNKADFHVTHKATLLLTEAFMESGQPNKDYSDIHSVSFSKNTYTLQSVHPFFLILCFIIKNDTNTHTQYNYGSSLKHAAIYIIL